MSRIYFRSIYRLDMRLFKEQDFEVLADEADEELLGLLIAVGFYIRTAVILVF